MEKKHEKYGLNYVEELLMKLLIIPDLEKNSKMSKETRINGQFF